MAVVEAAPPRPAGKQLMDLTLKINGRDHRLSGELKFKPELGRRTLVRALLQVRTMEV
jgi:hypothetical protein